MRYFELFRYLQFSTHLSVWRGQLEGGFILLGTQSNSKTGERSRVRLLNRQLKSIAEEFGTISLLYWLRSPECVRTIFILTEAATPWFEQIQWINQQPIWSLQLQYTLINLGGVYWINVTRMATVHTNWLLHWWHLIYNFCSVEGMTTFLKQNASGMNRRDGRYFEISHQNTKYCLVPIQGLKSFKPN